MKTKGSEDHQKLSH